MLLRSRRATRTILVAGATVLAAALVGPVAPAGLAATCRVTNTASGVSKSSLQAAVDAAKGGQTLEVRGSCTGSTTVGKKLTIVGKPSTTLGKPMLLGTGVDRVVLVTSGAVVTIASLKVTDGDVSAAPDYPGNAGGGIRNEGTLTLRNVLVTGNAAGQGGGVSTEGNLALAGTTRITGNTAELGGGVDAEGLAGTPVVKLLDKARIDHNTATGGGGGVYASKAVITMGGTSQVDHNVSSGDAGGIQLRPGSLTMNGSASIHHNTGSYVGGVEVLMEALGEFAIVMNDQSSLHHNDASAPGGATAISAQRLIMNDDSAIYDNDSDLQGRVVEIYAWTDTETPFIKMFDASRIRDNDVAAGYAALTLYPECSQPVTTKGISTRVIRNTSGGVKKNIFSATGC